MSSFNAQKDALLPKRHGERQEMPRKGGFGCLELCLYGIRELASVSDLEFSTQQCVRVTHLCELILVVEDVYEAEDEDTDHVYGE